MPRTPTKTHTHTQSSCVCSAEEQSVEDADKGGGAASGAHLAQAMRNAAHRVDGNGLANEGRAAQSRHQVEGGTASPVMMHMCTLRAAGARAGEQPDACMHMYLASLGGGLLHKTRPSELHTRHAQHTGRWTQRRHPVHHTRHTRIMQRQDAHDATFIADAHACCRTHVTHVMSAACVRLSHTPHGTLGALPVAGAAGIRGRSPSDTRCAARP
jgi:hypothetical protein